MLTMFCLMAFSSLRDPTSEEPTSESRKLLEYLSSEPQEQRALLFAVGGIKNDAEGSGAGTVYLPADVAEGTPIEIDVFADRGAGQVAADVLPARRCAARVRA